MEMNAEMNPEKLLDQTRPGNAFLASEITVMLLLSI